MKKTVITIVVLVLIVLGLYLVFRTPKTDTVVVPETPTGTETPTGAMETGETSADKTKTVLGASAGGNPITAYHFGEGKDEVLFVGGIHGGYEWNTVLAAYELMDYLKATPSAIPGNVKVTVIPVLNPDGLKKVTGTTERFTADQVSKSNDVVVSGRFNANNVDLNRNFDCDWKAEGKWQNKTVSGGTAAFSEPESAAFKNYVTASKPKAAVVWYSSAGGVFASNCHDGVLDQTTALTNLYSSTSGYPAYKDFNFYEITGDMVNWLAKSKVPAISILLTNHTDTEWTKNKKGVDAVLQYFADKADATQ